MKIKINKKYVLAITILIIILAIGFVVVYGKTIEKNRNEQVMSKKIISQIQKSEKTIILPIEEVNEEVIIEEENNEGELENNKENEKIQENTTKNTNAVKNATTNNNNNVTSTSKYYIKINNLANVVTIYTKDEKGEYTKPIKAMICSTGTATPKSGKYKITTYRTLWNGLFQNVYGQYAVQITGNILFHSVPYTKNRDNSSLEWWEYDKLGTSASLRMC